MNLHYQRLQAQTRRQFLKDVVVRPGRKVLEVSVGTGANIWLLPDDAQYYGLDISWKMLERCRRNGKKHNRSIELVFGSAEHLPFRDERFDCVYHVGGINFFNDSLQAVREMIRVARPGTRIVISDEVEEVVNLGQLAPDQIHTPGIFVDAVLQGSSYEKRIERRTVRKMNF